MIVLNVTIGGTEMKRSSTELGSSIINVLLKSTTFGLLNSTLKNILTCVMLILNQLPK